LPSVNRAHIKNPQNRKSGMKSVNVSGSPNVPPPTPNSQMKHQSPVNPTRKTNIKPDESPSPYFSGFVSNLTPRQEYPQRAHNPVSVGIAPNLNRTSFNPTTRLNASDMQKWNPGSNLAVTPILPANREKKRGYGFGFVGNNNVPEGTRSKRLPDGTQLSQYGGGE